MSTLLEQASLVLIPSGYKEDVVYSQIPTNGSGDLSFTRASNGTRVNSAGLVEVCPWNLAEYSEDFTNAAWSTYEVTVTANTTIAPNGTTTADTIDAIAEGQRINQTVSVSALTSYTFSFYAKKGTMTTPRYTVFDLSNSAFILTQVDYSSLINSSTWSRVTATFTTPANCTSIGIYMINGVTTLGTIFLWGAQLNIGSTAKPYFPTTDRLNVPRLTYQNGGGGCPSLLLEKQSTNLCLYSEQFDNSAYNKISGGSATVPVVTANFATSPDGSQNADRIQFARTGTTASDFSAINQSSLTLSATGTTTIYLKSNTSSNQNVLMYWGGGQGQVFVVTPSWQRFTLSNLSVGTDAIVFGTRGGSGNFFNGGDLTLDILAWGAQLEASSYPTSYISTTSASATRVQDICKRNISSFVGTNKGTIFWQGIVPPYTGVANYVFDLSDLTNFNLNRFAIYGITTNNTAQLYTSSSAGTNFALTYNSFAKIAVVWNGTSCDLYVNGTQLISGKNILNSNPTNLHLNTRYSEDENATTQVGQVILFNTNLSGAECIALTTI